MPQAATFRTRFGSRRWRACGRADTTAFDGGRITSDSDVLLLATAERLLGMVERFAGLIADPRTPQSYRAGKAGVARHEQDQQVTRQPPVESLATLNRRTPNTLIICAPIRVERRGSTIVAFRCRLLQAWSLACGLLSAMPIELRDVAHRSPTSSPATTNGAAGQCWRTPAGGGPLLNHASSWERRNVSVRGENTSLPPERLHVSGAVDGSSCVSWSLAPPEPDRGT